MRLLCVKNSVVIMILEKSVHEHNMKVVVGQESCGIATGAKKLLMSLKDLLLKTI